MALLYFTSNSTNANTYAHRVSLHCKSFLECECIIPEGKISKEETLTNLETCDVLIVVIYNKPVSYSVSTFNLIDNSRLRSEIILAINRDILIIPILIDGSKLPGRNNVPGSLKKLVEYKSFSLRTHFWAEDIELFLEYLEAELEFIIEVNKKLAHSVQINYQRLADFDGHRKKEGALDLTSFTGMELRKLVDAEKVFLQKARVVGDILSEKKALSALALVYARLGQTLKSIKYFQEELKIARDIRDFKEICALLASLGDAYAISGNIILANKFYEEQRVLAEEKNFPNYISSAYNGLGYVCVQQKNIKKAIEYYFKALSGYRKLENHDKQLELLVGIALNYQKLGQWQKTTDSLNQALDIAKYLENRKEELHIRLDLVESYFAQSKKDLAIHQLNKVEESLKISDNRLPSPLIHRIDLLRNRI